MMKQVKFKWNKKVLLCDRKRHTAHCVASTHSAVLFWGKPCPDWGYPNPVLAGGTYPCPGVPPDGTGAPQVRTGVPFQGKDLEPETGKEPRTGAVADLRGGARDVPPPAIFFFHFHAVFRKN